MKPGGGWIVKGEKIRACHEPYKGTRSRTLSVRRRVPTLLCAPRLGRRDFFD
jgi:hypothetical protein